MEKFSRLASPPPPVWIGGRGKGKSHHDVEKVHHAGVSITDGADPFCTLYAKFPISGREGGDLHSGGDLIIHPLRNSWL